jgi:hypothetical protein
MKIPELAELGLSICLLRGEGVKPIVRAMLNSERKRGMFLTQKCA